MKNHTFVKNRSLTPSSMKIIVWRLIAASGAIAVILSSYVIVSILWLNYLAKQPSKLFDLESRIDEGELVVQLRNKSFRAITVNLSGDSFDGYFDFRLDNGKMIRAMEKSVFGREITTTGYSPKLEIAGGGIIVWKIPMADIYFYDRQHYSGERIATYSVELPKLTVIPYLGGFAEGQFAVRSRSVEMLQNIQVNISQ